MVDPSRRGFNRYTYSLAKALLDIEDVEIWLFSMAPVHETFLRDLAVRVVTEPRFKATWWEQVELPRTIKKLKLDVFHAPATMGLPLRRVCPYVLTIHDVMSRAVPDVVGRDSKKARMLQAVSRYAASRIITVSEHSKRDICRYLGVAAERVEVIPEAADASFHVVEDRTIVDTAIRRYGLDAPYLLYVGGFDRRKNVDALIRAYAQTTGRHKAPLVLVGASDEQSARLHATAESNGIGNRVRSIGYVPDHDLALIYNGASAFIYPSLYEGFGLPVIEAMACGAPVLTSNRASLPEVVGDAALMFDPTRIDDIAAAIDRLFTDGDEMSRLRSRGLDVAGRLTWRKTAERTLAVYRSALATTGQS